jgi:hypothetical protein
LLQCQSPYFVTSKLSKIRHASLFTPNPDVYAEASVKKIGTLPFAVALCFVVAILLLSVFVLSICSLVSFLALSFVCVIAGRTWSRVCLADVAAAVAVAAAGCGASIVPYWAHALQDRVLQSLPHWALSAYLLSIHASLRARFLKKR